MSTDSEQGFRPQAVYALDRDEDMTGVSGTGRVGYALEYAPGVIVLWDREPATLSWFPSLDAVKEVHCHHGHTVLTKLDDERDWVEPFEKLVNTFPAANATMRLADPGTHQ